MTTTYLFHDSSSFFTNDYLDICDGNDKVLLNVEKDGTDKVLLQRKKVLARICRESWFSRYYEISVEGKKSYWEQNDGWFSTDFLLTEDNRSSRVHVQSERAGACEPPEYVFRRRGRRVATLTELNEGCCNGLVFALRIEKGDDNIVVLLCAAVLLYGYVKAQRQNSAPAV